MRCHFTEREASLWMIFKDAWKPRERRIGKGTATLERGEFAASLRFMQKAWGWASNRRVGVYLAALQKRGMVRVTAGADFTVVTICNYDKYQDDLTKAGRKAGQDAGQPRGARGAN
jgi:hypothetical protein